jgi:hypothetical protein
MSAAWQVERGLPRRWTIAKIENSGSEERGDPVYEAHGAFGRDRKPVAHFWED